MDVPCGEGEVIPLEERPLPPASEVRFLFFDIETSGTESICSIMQIGAKLEGPDNHTFSAYAYPMNGIPSHITSVTRLSIENGELCYNGKPVECTSLHNLLSLFLDFLKSLGGSIVLVSHNANFDLRHIIDSFAENHMLDELVNLVVGVCDTLPLMKRNPIVMQDVEKAIKSGQSTEGIVVNRKKAKAQPDKSKQVAEPPRPIPIVKLSVLAARYLPKYSADGAHEALADCNALEDLCTALDITRDCLCGNSKPIATCVARRRELLNQKKFIPGLAEMIIPNVVSVATVRKLAQKALTVNKLVQLLNDSGETNFCEYIKEHITNRAVSVEAIYSFVRAKQSVLM